MEAYSELASLYPYLHCISLCYRDVLLCAGVWCKVSSTFDACLAPCTFLESLGVQRCCTFHHVTSCLQREHIINYASGARCLAFAVPDFLRDFPWSYFCGGCMRWECATLWSLPSSPPFPENSFWGNLKTLIINRFAPSVLFKIWPYYLSWKGSWH